MSRARSTKRSLRERGLESKAVEVLRGVGVMCRCVKCAKNLLLLFFFIGRHCSSRGAQNMHFFYFGPSPSPYYDSQAKKLLFYTKNFQNTEKLWPETQKGQSWKRAKHKRADASGPPCMCCVRRAGRICVCFQLLLYVVVKWFQPECHLE